MKQTGPTAVAIVNTNPDLVRLLRFALEAAGFVVFVYHIDAMREGTADVESLLREHDPKVVIYDVAPPYANNWNFLQHLRTHTHFKGRKFVLTSMNARRMHEIVGDDETVYEIVGQPDDLDEIVRAAKEASRARATR
jgi:DNA-binding response OmpR family regulator